MSEATMSKLLHDLQAVVEDAESLLSATANSSALKACSENVMICPANPATRFQPCAMIA